MTYNTLVMDPSIGQEIVKTSHALRKKFESMRRGMQDVQEERKSFFAPVLQPLVDIERQFRQQQTQQRRQPRVKTEKEQEELGEDESKSMWWDNESTVSPEKFIFETPIKKRRSKISNIFQSPSKSPIVEIKSENIEQTPSPNSSPSSSIYARSTLVPSEEVVVDLYETETPLAKKVREYVKTPQGEDELEQNLKSAGPLQRTFLEKLFKGGQKDLDSRYGLRVMPNGQLAIGDSTEIELFTNSDDISINGVVYEGTPGLLQLLYLKDPEGYSNEDLKNYKKILIATNAHKKGYSEERGLGGSRSIKYKKVISQLFPSRYLSSLTSSSSPLLQRLRSFKRGTGLMDEHLPIYEHYDDPNELVDRLRLLMASTAAGHKGHGNEIQSIIEELREENIIY